MKLCPRCQQTIGAECFAKNRSNADGLQNYCRSCSTQIHAEWRAKHRDIDRKHSALWRKNNPEKVRAGMERYYKEHPGQHYQDTKRWRAEHPEAKREQGARYYAKHKEQVTERTTAYRAQRAKQYYRYGANYRARKRGAGGQFSHSEWEGVRDYWGRCLCCGRVNVPLEADHIVPVSQGGSNSIDNIQPLCRSCNAKKNAKTVDYRLAYWWGL